MEEFASRTPGDNGAFRVYGVFPRLRCVWLEYQTSRKAVDVTCQQHVYVPLREGFCVSIDDAPSDFICQRPGVSVSRLVAGNLVVQRY